MRLKALMVALMALACIGLAAPQSALADELAGSKVASKSKRVHHHRARCCHVIPVDPYAYQFRPRGYYPYYGSAYWQPTSYVRHRDRLHYNVWNVQPPRYRYYQSWGYPKHWHHRQWHKAHHGYHHRWHW